MNWRGISTERGRILFGATRPRGCRTVWPAGRMVEVVVAAVVAEGVVEDGTAGYRSGTVMTAAVAVVGTVEEDWPRWRRRPPGWTVGGRTGTGVPVCAAGWPPWSTLGNGSVAVAVAAGPVG